MSFIDKDTIIIDGILPMYLKESFLRKKLINDSFAGGLMELGWGNGYVGLPKWHPWFNLHYDDIPVDIHGGLTYADFDDETGLWIIGFDTHHHQDNMTNCSFEYVKGETHSLMIQCLGVDGVDNIIRSLKLTKIKQFFPNNQKDISLF